MLNAYVPNGPTLERHLVPPDGEVPPNAIWLDLINPVSGEEKLVEQTMGTGPFSLVEWKKGEYILLQKNDKYWEPGLPLLDQIKIVVVPDDNNRILQLQGGQIDGMYDVPLNRVADLEKDSNFVVNRFVSTYNNFIALNTRNPPLSRSSRRPRRTGTSTTSKRA